MLGPLRFQYDTDTQHIMKFAGGFVAFEELLKRGDDGLYPPLDLEGFKEGVNTFGRLDTMGDLIRGLKGGNKKKCIISTVTCLQGPLIRGSGQCTYQIPVVGFAFPNTNEEQ